VDPTSAESATRVRDDRDYAVALQGTHIAVFENLGFVLGWVSDLFCVSSTGGRVIVRKLYTDSERTVLDITKALIVTAVDEVLTADDVLDRTIALNLPEILPADRTTEAAFWSAFNQALPRILGCLLDGLAQGLRDVKQIEMDGTPRLADFAKFSCAALPAMGIDADGFLRAFLESRRTSAGVILDRSLIADHLIALAPWSGRVSELLDVLNTRVDEEGRKRKMWPKNASMLSNELRHLVSALRNENIRLLLPPRTNRGQYVVIDRMDE
jgi:hypothetical protein